MSLHVSNDGLVEDREATYRKVDAYVVAHGGRSVPSARIEIEIDLCHHEQVYDVVFDSSYWTGLRP